MESRLANSDPNRIFRNHSGQFTETTPSTGYGDRGFGQGITVGDFNDDGFPDLFNANIGENRLYQNNGDGTFTEISKQAGLSGASWTTSATLADLDGDGISDLFETAYCGGDDPTKCPARIGKDFTPLARHSSFQRNWIVFGKGKAMAHFQKSRELVEPGNTGSRHGFAGRLLG